MNRLDPKAFHLILGRRSIQLLGGDEQVSAEAMGDALFERFPHKSIAVSVDVLADEDVLVLPSDTPADELAEIERRLLE